MYPNMGIPKSNTPLVNDLPKTEFYRKGKWNLEENKNTMNNKDQPRPNFQPKYSKYDLKGTTNRRSILGLCTVLSVFQQRFFENVEILHNAFPNVSTTNKSTVQVHK